MIATWPTPNYVDPPNRGPGVVYCAIILASIGVLVVAARLYSRLFITRAPGIDDLLIVVAMALGVALTVLVILGHTEYHTGYHIWDIRPTTAPGHRLNVWISQWCYLWSTGFIKISILLFYRRLSVSFNRPFYWAVFAGITYNVLQLVGFSIGLLTLCQPVRAYWLSFDFIWRLQNQGNYHCAYEGWSLTASGIVSIIGDFYAALLPSLLVMRLQMPIRQKFAVALLFAIGYIVVGLGIGRTISLNKVVEHDYDYTWELWASWIWSLTELWVGLIAASAPALKPFFVRYLIDPISSAVHSRSQSRQKASKGYATPSTPSQQASIRKFIFQFPKSSTSSKHITTTTSTTSQAFSERSNTNTNTDIEAADLPLDTWYSATSPLPARNVHANYEYRGHGRCWSDTPEKSPSRHNSRRSHRRQGSSNSNKPRPTAVHAAATPAAALGHRPMRSADLGEEGVSPLRRNNTVDSVRSDADERWLIAPQKKGRVSQIGRTVEWEVVTEETMDGVPEGVESEVDRTHWYTDGSASSSGEAFPLPPVPGSRGGSRGGLR